MELTAYGRRRPCDKCEGKRTVGTSLLYKHTGPDGLHMRQPAELANLAAEQFTASSQNLKEGAQRPSQEQKETKGLLKTYCLEKSND